MTEPPNTEALLATVREALGYLPKGYVNDPWSALDAIASELEALTARMDRAERGRVKAWNRAEAAEAALQHEREVVRELSRQIDPLAERAGLGVRHATAQRMDADFTLQRRAEAAEAEHLDGERDEYLTETSNQDSESA